MRVLRAFLLVCVACPLAAQTTVIRAGRLLDPASGTWAANKVIVVENGRITSVGDAAPGPGAQVVDLTAYSVLPGLIDAHVHLGIGGLPRDNASAIVRAGFTTVVDLGARTTRILRIRDSINAGHIPGPRVLAAGQWVGTKNGVCEFNGLGLDGGPDAFAARVRENVAAGADVIKVCITGWPANAFASPDAYEIADASLDAVIREARAARRIVIAHDISAGGVRLALRAGVNGLAHAAYVDAPLAAAMRAKGMFVVTTLASLTGGDTSAASTALVAAVGVAHRAQVPLVFGTDGGVLPHGLNAREFAALRGAGISTLDGIRSATIVASRMLGLQDSVGRIAPGYSADFIAVGGDPLADPSLLERVRFVMARGRIMRPLGDTGRVAPR